MPTFSRQTLGPTARQEVVYRLIVTFKLLSLHPWRVWRLVLRTLYPTGRAAGLCIRSVAIASGGLWLFQDLGAVFAANLHNSRHIWRAGLFEDLFALFVEDIKATWRCDDPMFAGSRSGVAEFVREVSWAEEHVARFCFMPLIIEEDLEVAFDDDEDFVFIAMEVKRRAAARRGDGEAEDNRVVRMFAEEFEFDGVAERGDGLSFAR